MKLMIIAEDSFMDYPMFKNAMDSIIKDPKNTEILISKSNFIDIMTELYVLQHEIKVKYFYFSQLLYKQYTESYKMQEMLNTLKNYEGSLIAFWNGESNNIGNIINRANALKINIFVVKYDN